MSGFGCHGGFAVMGVVEWWEIKSKKAVSLR